MEIRDSRIDGGKAFDWGKTSGDYAKYRDIYPEKFYKKIAGLGLCTDNQSILDLGTGTGVLPRNMYKYGARWTGIDISPEQIEQAERLSEQAGMDISFIAVSAENADFTPASFDAVTACQCFWYFDHEKVVPLIARWLKPGGKLLILYMAWLPFEDRIAGASEELVLKYSPDWSGARETKKPVAIPEIALKYFDIEYSGEYDLNVPFTKESWHGRMKACRGVEASLSENELKSWEAEHRAMLDRIAPESFEVRHYAAMALLSKKYNSLSE